jgi:hypothetical protein
MIFYFNRENGRRVSKSTWKRSHAHGGTRFVRRSTTSQPKEGTPSEKPLTWQEYKEFAKKALEKLSKKKRASFNEEIFDGPEYGTGVDY